MRKIIVSLCALGLVSVSASALNIDNITPGNLKTRYSDIINTPDATLVLSGKADVRDLALLKKMSNFIKTVDMSGLEIVAYEYPSGDYMGRTTFAAGEIPPYLMAGAGVNTVILPENVKIIGESAFIGSKLESINLPVSLTKIGDFAFANSDALKTAHFRNCIELGVGVFKDCDALSDVTIDYQISEIPKSMFEGCSSFIGKIPSSVRTVGDFAYRGTAIETLDLCNLQKVGNYSFADMKDLKWILVSNDQKLEMGTGAFFNDGGIEYIPTFESDIATIAFSHTGGLMPNYVNSTNIAEGAFANNLDMDTVSFGPNLSYIGANAFRNDTNLKLVDVMKLEKKVPDVHEDAFSGIPLASDGKYDIDLNIDNVANAAIWEEHPVWGLFRIGHFTDSVEDIISDTAVEINMRKSGNSVYAESTMPIDYIGVFSVNGMSLGESTPGSNSASIGNLPEDEILVVKVISGGVSKIQKVK